MKAFFIFLVLLASMSLSLSTLAKTNKHFAYNGISCWDIGTFHTDKDHPITINLNSFCQLEKNCSQTKPWLNFTDDLDSYSTRLTIRWNGKIIYNDGLLVPGNEINTVLDACEGKITISSDKPFHGSFHISQNY